MARQFMLEWRNAVRDSELPRTTKLVAFVLSTYMDSNGAAFPSLLTLSKGASLGRGGTAVKRAIDRLEAAGLLCVDRRRGRFGWRYQAQVIPRAAVGFKSHAQPWDSDSLIPRAGTDKSHAQGPEIPRAVVGEGVERERECALAAPTFEEEQDQDPESRALRRLKDPRFSRMAKRLRREYASEFFVEALCDRGTPRAVAVAVSQLLDNEELAA